MWKSKVKSRKSKVESEKSKVEIDKHSVISTDFFDNNYLFLICYIIFITTFFYLMSGQSKYREVISIFNWLGIY
ncbi:hypothetical protein FLAVO9AF_30097 [Flavobacterium sp. 9AF]|nr:hypothetical protein FLAVO9AF_30097 [Flavobacterium sp. 9AF]